MQIGIVLVTFNRLEKLKIALKAFDRQTLSPAYVLVVNNASTDGTVEYLDAWAAEESGYKRYALTSDRNLGGSGGFHNGLKKAMSLDTDWIWVSDDDAFPEQDVLEKISLFLEDNSGMNLSAVCATVMDYDNIDVWHRRNIVFDDGIVKEKLIPFEEYAGKKWYEINTFSYVGSVLNRDKLKLVGLTNPGFFIFYDDTEHSLRLSKVGKIICLTDAIVHHDQSKAKIASSSWKDYYQLRNRLYTYRIHFGLKSLKPFIHPDRVFLLKSFLRQCLGKDTSVEYQAKRDALLGRIRKNELFLPKAKPTTPDQKG